MVQLQVHLVQCLLHMLKMDSSHLHQALPVTHQRAQRTDLLLGPEAGPQQTYRVQILQPLAVAHVGLASRHVLHMPRVDQPYLQTARLQHLEQRYPVHSGRLHRYRLDPAPLKPVRSRHQVFGKRLKPAHR